MPPQWNEFEEIDDDDGVAVIPIEPPGHSFRVSSSVCNGTDVLLADDDGVDETLNESIVIKTWSESPGSGPIPDESIVIETWSGSVD